MMTETRHFGQLTATVDHEKRIITLTLAPVRNPVFDVAKLERWARESLAEFQDYEWVGMSPNSARVEKIPLDELSDRLPPLRRRFRN